MKKIAILTLLVVSLFSCKESSKEDVQAILSESNGKINNVSIIIDDNLWNGEIGDSIRKKFLKDLFVKVATSLLSKKVKKQVLPRTLINLPSHKIYFSFLEQIRKMF